MLSMSAMPLEGEGGDGTVHPRRPSNMTDSLAIAESNNVAAVAMQRSPLKLKRSLSVREKKQKDLLEEVEAKVRFEQYASSNITKLTQLMEGDEERNHGFIALTKVNRAVVSIQRIVRGKLARRNFKKLEDARYAIRDLFIFLVYLVLHVFYGFSRKSSPDLFYLSDIMEDSMVHEEFPGPPDGGTFIRKTFEDVASIEEIWQYLEGPFKANVFDAECRERPELNCAGAMQRVNFHVGDIRMRQVRVKNRHAITGSTCSNPPIFKDFNVSSGLKDAPCYDSWAWDSKSLDEFGPSVNESSPEFKQLNESGALPCFQWTDDGFDKDRGNGVLSSALFMTGGWVWWDSQIGFRPWQEYPRNSGFTCMFPVDKDPAAKLAQLKANDWIDASTRAVVIELGVFNPPTNLFSTMRLFFEFPRTGGVRPYYEAYTGLLFGKNDADTYVRSWVFMALLVLITTFYVGEEIGEIRTEGFMHWSASLWNWIDIFNYMLFFGCFYLTVVSEIEGNNLSATARSPGAYGSGYVDLQILVGRYRNIDYAFSINLVVVFVKLFKYVRLSPKLSMITDTLAGSWQSAGSFFLIFFILLFAFALALWFTYSHLIWSFRTFPDTFYACLLALLGANSDVFVYETYQHNRFLGPILTLMFLFLMSIVSFSMFLAMVGDAFEAAKARGKAKRGLDPLLVQIVLQTRKIKMRLETASCCCCFKDPFDHVYEKGDSLKVKKGKRKKLSRETTVLDMMTGKNGANMKSFWELVGGASPWVIKKTKQDIKNSGRVDFAGSWKMSQYFRSRPVNNDVLAQRANLEKARLLLIEKTVLEILMRMETLMLGKSGGGIASFSDVTRVHFANLTLEQEILHRQAKRWLKANPSVTKSPHPISKPGTLGATVEQVKSRKDPPAAMIKGFFGAGVKNSSKYAVNAEDEA